MDVLGSERMREANRDEQTRVDSQGFTFVWGDPATWKAELRAESWKRHLARSPGERLLAALELIRRDQRGGREAP